MQLEGFGLEGFWAFLQDLPGCLSCLWEPAERMQGAPGSCHRALPAWTCPTSLLCTAGQMHQQSYVLHRHRGCAGPVLLLLACAEGAHVGAPALHQRLSGAPPGPQCQAMPVQSPEVWQVRPGSPDCGLVLICPPPVPTHDHNKGQCLTLQKAGGCLDWG